MLSAYRKIFTDLDLVYCTCGPDITLDGLMQDQQSYVHMEEYRPGRLVLADLRDLVTTSLDSGDLACFVDLIKAQYHRQAETGADQAEVIFYAGSALSQDLARDVRAVSATRGGLKAHIAETEPEILRVMGSSRSRTHALLAEIFWQHPERSMIKWLQRAAMIEA